jgi:hypothetical protein
MPNNGWMFAYEVGGDERELEDEVLEIFVDLLMPHGGAVGANETSWGATIFVDVDDPLEAIAASSRVVHAAAAAAGLPEFPPGRIELQPYEELDRELALDLSTPNPC